MRTVALLLVSNVFMTVAWYGHLRFKGVALWKVILVSWGIAFFEYCLAVPANRIGHGTFTVTQLKVMQEAISLTVFAGFTLLFLKERIAWNHVLAFAFLVAAVYLVFLPTPGASPGSVAH
jgi:uncharacterized protein (DUF486 family)